MRTETHHKLTDAKYKMQNTKDKTQKAKPKTLNTKSIYKTQNKKKNPNSKNHK